MQDLGPISQTAYLTAENVHRYRAIMRIFYEEYEKMRFQLYKEDVLERLIQMTDFKDYTMEQLKQDLAALVNWQNLTPLQDPRRVFTIADYQNKQFRYSMSEYAVEIERLTVRLENLFIESGSLSPHYFIRILTSLEKMRGMMNAPLKDVNQWWRSLQEDFRILNQNYQDYLREFYSGQSEKLLKSVEFLLHKDRFISYLREFIRELQNYSGKIQVCLDKVPKAEVQLLLERVVASELDIPRPAGEEREDLEEYIRKNVEGKWLALELWFSGSETQPSESAQVLEITNEVIRKMIQNAAMILQMHGWGISRRDDYKKFIRLFQDCSTLEEAHRLSAFIFGAAKTCHYVTNYERETDSINSGVYEEPPSAFSLRPRTNKYRPRVDKSGFESRALEKLARRQVHLEKLERDKTLVMKYVKDGSIRLWEIEDVISPEVRTIFLRWIGAANTTIDKRGRTEYGQPFTLEKEEGTFMLNCEDGQLQMPKYHFRFLDRDSEDSHRG